MSNQSQAGFPRIDQPIVEKVDATSGANICDCGDSSEYGEVICCERE